MSKVYESSFDLIGISPIVRLKNYEKLMGVDAEIYVKPEWFNLAGSIKDKVAYQMITDMERDGRLKKGSTIIEPTSGNTGVGIASIGAVKGYRVIIVMPETMSKEKQQIMKAYGAEIVLTEGKKGMAGSVDKANELQKSIKDSVVLGQFDNPSNVSAHYNFTGKEILDGIDVDIFVAGIGTGGTVSGTGKYLKERKKGVLVYGVEPYSSPLLTKGSAGPHKIQGIGANFVPSILDKSVLDGVIDITDEEAYQAVKDIARTEGMLLGISGGANAIASVKLAKDNKNKKIVFISADSGERYLTSDLFE